jgi:hypothetical protein
MTAEVTSGRRGTRLGASCASLWPRSLPIELSAPARRAYASVMSAADTNVLVAARLSDAPVALRYPIGEQALRERAEHRGADAEPGQFGEEPLLGHPVGRRAAVLVGRQGDTAAGGHLGGLPGLVRWEGRPWRLSSARSTPRLVKELRNR